MHYCSVTASVNHSYNNENAFSVHAPPIPGIFKVCLFVTSHDGVTSSCDITSQDMVVSAQSRSVVYNVVWYPQGGAQRKSHKPRQTDGTNSITSTADTGGKYAGIWFA